MTAPVVPEPASSETITMTATSIGLRSGSDAAEKLRAKKVESDNGAK